MFKVASDANNKITVTSSPMGINATTSSGTQGKNPGAMHGWIADQCGDGGAGALGGSSVIQAGACVMIICRILSADMAAISTGAGASKVNSYARGGGGTGMCYLAYQEAL